MVPVILLTLKAGSTPTVALPPTAPPWTPSRLPMLFSMESQNLNASASELIFCVMLPETPAVPVLALPSMSPPTSTE